MSAQRSGLAVGLGALLLVSAGGCGSSTPQALRVPACSLVSVEEVQIALGVVTDLRPTLNRPGACTYTGTAAGVGTASLGYAITTGIDAKSVPAGVTGKMYQEPVFYGPDGKGGSVEGYWIPASPSVNDSSPSRSLYSGVLSASKDGYLIRITISSKVSASFPASQVMAVLLPQV
jgi:hypothetical protein